jgi:hypothetical protein
VAFATAGGSELSHSTTRVAWFTRLIFHAQRDARVECGW